MSVSKLVLCLTIMNELIEALKKEVVVITFKKIDTGDIRSNTIIEWRVEHE